MAPSSPSPAETLAPVRRSVTVGIELLPSTVVWGATWACVCGIVAAAPWAPSVQNISRALAVWLVSVPLLGAAWSRAIAAAGHEWQRAAEPPLAAIGEWPREISGRLEALAGAWRDGRATPIHGLGAAVAALALAALLPSGVFALTAIGVGVVAAGWLAPARRIGAAGWLRSGLEIGLPAAMGWLALSGPRSVPAPVWVYDGFLTGARTWLGANWAIPALCVAFTVVHRASTMEEPGHPRVRLGAIMVGYFTAVGALAVADRPLGAAALALIFVAQWPLQSLVLRGRLRSHLLGSQGFAMAAMLIAFAGGRTG